MLLRPPLAIHARFRHRHLHRAEMPRMLGRRTCDCFRAANSTLAARKTIVFHSTRLSSLWCMRWQHRLSAAKIPGYSDERDPDTGRRVNRPNPPNEWQTIDSPHLRIVSDELYEA